MRKSTLSKTKKIDTYHHGDLKHAIIQASLQILSKNCVHALSLRAAAKQAGVSPAAPYRHFPTKAALLAQLAVHGFNTITASLQKAAQEHPANPTDQMLAAGISYLRFAQENPELLRLMYAIDMSGSLELEQAHINCENTFFKLIQQGQAKKVITAGDPENLGFVAFSFIHGLSLLLIDKHVCQEHALPQGSEMEQWVRELFRIVWNGFGNTKIQAPALQPTTPAYPANNKSKSKKNRQPKP